MWTGPAVMEVGGEGPTDDGGTSRAGGWLLRMGPTVLGVEGEECTAGVWEVGVGPELLGGGRWGWDQYCWVLCKKLMQNMLRVFCVARWLPCRQMTTMPPDDYYVC